MLWLSGGSALAAASLLLNHTGPAIVESKIGIATALAAFGAWTTSIILCFIGQGLVLGGHHKVDAPLRNRLPIFLNYPAALKWFAQRFPNVATKIDDKTLRLRFRPLVRQWMMLLAGAYAGVFLYWRALGGGVLLFFPFVPAFVALILIGLMGGDNARSGDESESDSYDNGRIYFAHRLFVIAITEYALGMGLFAYAVGSSLLGR